jgi:hypothetical protein
MADRRRVGTLIRPAVLIAVLAVVAMAPASAQAAASHAYALTFGSASSSPANPYPLSQPSDVEVDKVTHDVYVTDPGHARVEKFDSSGHLLLMFGDEVDQTTGADVCTIASGDTCKTGVPGNGPAAFEAPTYLAVDNTSGPSAGDIYVGDTETNLVQKFDSGGHLITSWGQGGQKNGSDASDLPVYGPTIFGVAVGGPEENFYVGGTHYSDNVWKYTQDGTYIPPYRGTSGQPWLKADNEGNLYFSRPAEGFFSPPTVWAQTPNKGSSEYTAYQLGLVTPLTGFSLDPTTEEVYQDTGEQIAHYPQTCHPPLAAPCEAADLFGLGKLSSPRGLGVDGGTHAVYVASSGNGTVEEFIDVRPVATTGPPTGATESEVTLTGTADPNGHGNVISCKFEYGFTKKYGKTAPCSPDPSSSPFSSSTPVTATIGGFSPGTKDHYRIVITNEAGGISFGLDRTFITTQPPGIDGLTAENLTATTAELIAKVNPNGLETEYQFEYGPTPGYGEVSPASPLTIEASNSDQEVKVELTNLTPHVVYHYRIRAVNSDGTTLALDHTFNFYPPGCPNENVRQQVKANFLPDCRAYELVSPGDAGGTQLYPGGPNTGLATSPSRLSFTGLWSTIPGSGGKPIDANGDLYVATRTSTGWVTKYVGLPSDQAAIAGGPAMGLPVSAGVAGTGAFVTGLPPYFSNGGAFPDKIQNSVLTDSGMNRFLDWNDGNQSVGSSFGGDYSNKTPVASNAPYVWSAEGQLLDRWPTNLAAVPPGHFPLTPKFYRDGGYGEGQEPLTVSPGGVNALDCPAVQQSGGGALSGNYCPGDITASADLSHLVFATEWNVFAPGGQLSAPGSVYDNNTESGTVSVASKTPGGVDIPSEPGDGDGDPLQIPAVSSDGSHILMASPGIGGCGLIHCGTPSCSDFFGAAQRCPLQPSHLYMRVDGSITYDVSKGADVLYAGMTNDGSKVYFTSSAQLTPDDTDSSVDLYMWSESTDSVTRVSTGNNGAGNSDNCNSEFTVSCGVVLYSNASLCSLASGEGGNCRSDNSVAADNGDIYFFSPEQLDGTRGVQDQENLYDYRDGEPQFVATLEPGQYCFVSPNPGFTDSACSDTPIARIQVSPDDSHMAFATASQVTQYDNAGKLEMYTYEPGSRALACASCLPSGKPPTSDISASQDGLFMTNDGRTFFATEDALVHGDTNHAIDIYEYVDGRPQLITQGTGETSVPGGILSGIENAPGLLGVSANGTDVYFSTLDTLVPQDHNGLFLKMYDARTGGGFPSSPPPPPCAAADECHGVGSSSEEPIVNGTGAALGSGGNLEPPKKGAKKAKKEKPSKKRHRRHHHRKASR